MAKYKVVIGTLFMAGQKYRRGDIVECANPQDFGTRLEMVAEPNVEEKPKPARKPRAKKAAE